MIWASGRQYVRQLRKFPPISDIASSCNFTLPPFCSRVYVCVHSVGADWKDNRTESEGTVKFPQKWTGNTSSAMLTIAHLTKMEVLESTGYVNASFYGEAEEESFDCVSGFP